MSESIVSEITRKPSAMIRGARAVAWSVPLCLWLVHIFIIVPILNTQSGDAQFFTAMGFFMLSGSLMIVGLLLSMIVFFKERSLRHLVPVLLNLSWLYYLKVWWFGPTIGNL